MWWLESCDSMTRRIDARETGPSPAAAAAGSGWRRPPAKSELQLLQASVPLQCSLQPGPGTECARQFSKIVESELQLLQAAVPLQCSLQPGPGTECASLKQFSKIVSFISSESALGSPGQVIVDSDERLCCYVGGETVTETVTMTMTPTMTERQKTTRGRCQWSRWSVGQPTSSS